MIVTRNRRAVVSAIVLAVAACGLGIQPSAAHAEAAYPSKPIRLVVPFPPGGGGDRLGRLLADPLAKALHTDVVVENQGGANGNIALQTVARADPDGYVLGLTLIDHIAVNPFIHKNLSYDPLKDFKAVGMVLSTPYVIAVGQDGPATLADLVARAKARPGEVSIGYPTINIQMAMLEFGRRTDTELNLIPYRGIAQGMPDMLGGRLTAWVGTSVTMRGFIEGGKVRGLGVTSAERSPALPDVPTVAESGYPGYEQVTWYGIVAPARTPDETIGKINRALNEVLHSPAVKAEIERDGARVIGGPPEPFMKALEADMRRLGPMIKAAGVKTQ
ncbi:tripartite tricarboxylate transporter substrate binding protein [Bordetella sp. BOR01]|nr:tripartite tricarboxylate transporter substrate binding protein [Bordetella sp. BOR01]